MQKNAQSAVLAHDAPASVSEFADERPVETIVPTATQKSSGLMNPANLAMAGCCLAMLGGGALLLWGSGSQGSLGDMTWLGVSLVGCLAMHVVMHKFMGKSCHSTGEHKGEKK